MPTGTYRAEVQRGFAGATGRVREPEAQRVVEADLAASVRLVELAAHSAMAALMLVRPLLLVFLPWRSVRVPGCQRRSKSISLVTLPWGL